MIIAEEISERLGITQEWFDALFKTWDEDAYESEIALWQFFTLAVSCKLEPIVVLVDMVRRFSKGEFVSLQEIRDVSSLLEG